MKRFFKVLSVILLFVGCTTLVNSMAVKYTKKNDYRMSAYIALTEESFVASMKMENITHAYISFAYIGEGNKITLENPAIEDKEKRKDDADKIAEKIKMLREQHKDKKIGIAVGGYGADGFSDMALTKETRTEFIQSVREFIVTYNLDGVDIDWEYPVTGGNGIIKCRPEDKENFTYLMEELNVMLKSLETDMDKKYELSFAQASTDEGFDNIELDKLEPIVDVVNLMAYDYTGQWSKTTAHNANLYKGKNKSNPEMKQISTDDAIKKYEKTDFPLNKVVLGIPIYGYEWTGVPEGGTNGLYQQATECTGGISYRDIKAKCLDKEGYIRYWDEDAKAPYLYNGDKFITYDDEESVNIKAEYIRKNKLGGAMFWEYTQDYNEEIIGQVNKIIRR